MSSQNKPPLFEFAYCRNFDGMLDDLAELAPEDWGNGQTDKKHPILYNYIHHTFKRTLEETELAIHTNQEAKIMVLGEYACFNTGLFTDNYEPIYGVFEKHKFPQKQEWYLLGFYEEGHNNLKAFSYLPERASYFSDISDLIFDFRLPIRPQLKHILGDPENMKRLPPALQEPSKKGILTSVVSGQIEIVKKRVAANYKLAVPQFYEGSVQLLLPLCLEDGITADLALVVKKVENFYTARTCLTMEMAYNNARLIAKPETDWLKPGS